MAFSRHPIIAKEGWSLIFIASLVVASVHYFAGNPAIVLWLIPLLLAWFYRDPNLKLPSRPLGLVSPVSGVVVSAEPHPDPYLGRDALLFRVCMSVTDVFSIRSVTEGKIIQQWLDAEEGDDDARSLTHAIQVKTDENDDIMIVLRPGRYLKKLSCDAVIGQRIGQGHRCGVIPFGSCVDVYVPAESIINVNIGDRVVAGKSLLATLKSHS